MSRTLRAAIVGMIAAIAVAAILAGTGVLHSPVHHDNSCHATQPVYSGPANVGTWQVTLAPGQSVRLPDGDTAVCTASGLAVI